MAQAAKRDGACARRRLRRRPEERRQQTEGGHYEDRRSVARRLHAEGHDRSAVRRDQSHGEERAMTVANAVAVAAAKYGLSPELLAAQVLVESSGDPYAFRYEPMFFRTYIFAKKDAKASRF